MVARFHQWSLYLRMLGKGVQPKATVLLVFFLWLAKLVNGFRTSQSNADLLTVASTARAFNKFGATRALALDISKAFDRVWHAALLHKLKSYGVSDQIFGLISSFLSSRWL